MKTERANLFEPNVYITMLVKLKGSLVESDIENAVKSAYEANEITMSKVVLEENGEAYYERIKSTGCKVILEKSHEENTWKSIRKESEKSPFALDKGELIRTFILTKNGKIQILIHAHHLAGDGKSILILLRDIMDSLDGKELIFKPMVLMEGEYLKKRAKLPFGIKFALKKVNYKWEKTGKAFTWKEYYAIHQKYWENHSSDIEIQTYSIDELKKHCKNGITLNSYLVTKLLKEYPRSKVTGIPLSIREDNAAMSNQTSGIVLKYRYNPKRSFEENTRQVHKRIYKNLRNVNIKYFVLCFIEQLSPTLLDSVLLYTHGCYQHKISKKLADIMGYTGNKGRDLGVTNLGKIDIPDTYKDFEIQDILFVPPQISYTKNIIGISSFNDTLNIVYPLKNG